MQTSTVTTTELNTISDKKVSVVLIVVLSIVVASTVAKPHHDPDHKEGDHQQLPQETHTRVERSPQHDRGSIDVGVHEQRGRGTSAGVQGKGTVWQSDDGRSRVNVEGHWSKAFQGPQTKPQYGGSVIYERTFPGK